MEQQRTEAYKNYMSDSLLLINTFISSLSKEDIPTLPRYADMFGNAEDEGAGVQKEDAQQIYHRFDKLRRAG